MVEDRWDELDDGLGADSAPFGFGPEVDPTLGDFGSGGAVEGDNDGDGTGTLAVGAVVVGAGMLDPAVGVRVHLRDAGHPFDAQVAAGRADRSSRHNVVPGPKDRVGDGDVHRDVHLVVRRDARVLAFIDAEPVQVRDSLDTRLVLREQVENGLPEGFGDADLGGHAASVRVDGPRYAELLRALWIRLSVASSRSLPGRHLWSSLGAWLVV